LIPGGLKQRLHKKARGDRFSEILVDIYQNIIPDLTILDGVWGMDGHGPASGSPQKAGLILASQNTVALDIAASTIMDFKPKEIPAIKYAIQRKLYPNYKFELVGLKKLPCIHFRKPIKGKTSSRVRRFGELPIICDIKKCIKCGTCAKHCPVKAIKLKPYPEIDKRKCIRCFCCMEVCPVHALSLGKMNLA
jgi:ferredoxin